MTAGIVINKLTKTYPGAKVPALDALSLQVAEGEVYGFLGANGAGKSTTIRLLMNFLQPTGGSAKVAGLDIVKDNVEVKKHVGYLAGDVALYQKATGKELLDYLSALQGTDTREYRAQLEKRFEAETNKPIGELSKGNRQKIGILQALMHRPSVLILDEPTSGLDPLMQEVFYESVREARGRGAAVFMSSHNLAEAQSLCDRVGIIKHGKLVREQAVAEMGSLTTPTFTVTFRSHDSVNALKKEKALKILEQTDSNALRMQPTGEIAPALAALAKHDIVSIASERADLEDEFLNFYGGSE
ncbi:ABC transporter ATP-binding protein [Candidatus Saccharibacteria bacterium]|nr:MAG: ABC transporter ATP-binding protein [Candidatus Saccharibacteria bacterium]